MVNRWTPSASVFSISSVGQAGYCQCGAGLCGIQNNKMKHSSWASIIIAAMYLKHLPDSVQEEDSIYQSIFMWLKKKNKTKLMCMESAEYPCCVLSDMVIFAGTWAVTMGDTQMKQIWKAIQVTKTGACISFCYQLSGHLWSPHFEISLSMFIYKILRK